MLNGPVIGMLRWYGFETVFRKFYVGIRFLEVG